VHARAGAGRWNQLGDHVPEQRHDLCRLAPAQAVDPAIGERLAMYVQGVDRVYDLNSNGREDSRKVSYGDEFLQAEREYSRHYFEHADTEMLFEQFRMAESACHKYLEAGWSSDGNARRHQMALPAYDQCIKASHVFNLLDARGVISVTERQSYILRVRELAKGCGEAWLATEAGGA
jgi:glycyl-tRNA synthetase alpha chain